jgi:biopolymer transport protein ExbB/TolQ
MDYSSINPATMFYAAGIVGKSDIILLLAASIYTWARIVMGAYFIVKVSRSTQSARAGAGVGAALTPEAAAPAALASGGGGK